MECEKIYHVKRPFTMYDVINKKLELYWNIQNEINSIKIEMKRNEENQTVRLSELGHYLNDEIEITITLTKKTEKQFTGMKVEVDDLQQHALNQFTN